MKRILSLVLAMVMVLGSFSAVFAVEPTAADEAVEILMDLGVLTEGKLEQDLKRQDAIVLLSRLMGEEEEAKAFPSEDLAFVDVTDSFYKGYISWAVANELTKGKSETKFGFGEFLKTQELAMFLLRALGYGDVEFDNALTEATTLGLLVDVAEGVTAKRGMMAVMTLNALKTNSKGTEVTLATKLGHVLPEEEVVVPATFELEGVTATNLREVDVVFNKSVDEDSLNKDNFLLGTTKATSVELLEDAKTVRAIFTMAQQTEYTLTIKTVKDIDGLEVKDATKKFTAFDTVAPLVESVEVFGNKKVVVTFTEPVDELTAKSLVNYKIDDKLFGAKVTVVGRKVHLELTTRLADGVHKVVASSDIKDYAGFRVLANSNEIVVAKDDVKPAIASVDKVTQMEVVITFTKPVESNFSASAVVGKLIATDPITTKDNLTYTLKFGGGSPAEFLPLSGTEITLKDVTDYYGNKDTIKANVVPTVDLVRPEVKLVTVKAQNEIVVEFTKEVNLDGTYTLKTTGETPVTKAVNAPTYVKATDKTKLSFTTTSDLSAEKYTLEITGVTDTTPLKNVLIPSIQTIDVADLTKPGLAGDKVYYVAPTKKDGATEAKDGAIYVYFNEPVDSTSALDKANYSFVIDSKPYALGSSNAVSLLANQKVVKIVIPALADTDANSWTMSSATIVNVKDLAGNVMLPEYITPVKTTGLAASVTVQNAKATAVNKVVVEVSKDVNPYSVVASDFVLKYDTNKLVYVIGAEHKVVEGGSDTITLTLNEDLTPDAKFATLPVQVFIIAGNLADIYGNKVALSSAGEYTVAGNVADAIVPTVKVAKHSDTAVKFTFSENVSVVGLANILKVKKANGTVEAVTGAVYAVNPDGTKGLEISDLTTIKTFIVELGVADVTKVTVGFPFFDTTNKIEDKAAPVNKLLPTGWLEVK